jgi:ribosome-binding protein aMBF1 (putative translation factor)
VKKWLDFAGCDPVEDTLAYRQHHGVPTPSKHSRHPVLASLGSAIRSRRRELGLSQEQLAERAGLDRSYLGQVERGENSIALLPLINVATALGVTLEQLMGQARL